MRKVERAISIAELATEIEEILEFADRVGASATALWLDRALIEAHDEARGLGATIDLLNEGLP